MPWARDSLVERRNVMGLRSLNLGHKSLLIPLHVLHALYMCGRKSKGRFNSILPPAAAAAIVRSGPGGVSAPACASFGLLSASPTAAA